METKGIQQSYAAMFNCPLNIWSTHTWARIRHMWLMMMPSCNDINTDDADSDSIYRGNRTVKWNVKEHIQRVPGTKHLINLFIVYIHIDRTALRVLYIYICIYMSLLVTLVGIPLLYHFVPTYIHNLFWLYILYKIEWPQTVGLRLWWV